MKLSNECIVNYWFCKDNFAFGIKLNSVFVYFYASLFHILAISFLNVDYVLKYFKN